MRELIGDIVFVGALGFFAGATTWLCFDKGILTGLSFPLLFVLGMWLEKKSLEGFYKRED